MGFSRGSGGSCRYTRTQDQLLGGPVQNENVFKNQNFKTGPAELAWSPLEHRPCVIGNHLLQTRRPEMMQTRFLTALEARTPNRVSWAGIPPWAGLHFLLRLDGRTVSLPLPVPGAACAPWLVPPSSCFRCHTSHCRHSHILCVCPIRRLHLGPTLDHPGCSQNSASYRQSPFGHIG